MGWMMEASEDWRRAASLCLCVSFFLFLCVHKIRRRRAPRTSLDLLLPAGGSMEGRAAGSSRSGRSKRKRRRTKRKRREGREGELLLDRMRLPLGCKKKGQHKTHAQDLVKGRKGRKAGTEEPSSKKAKRKETK
jgi:hypothetical protein